jgi:hypothetical protein
MNQDENGKIKSEFEEDDEIQEIQIDETESNNSSSHNNFSSNHSG